MDDLVQFLRARLDEIEAAARRAMEGPRNQFVSADEDVEPLLFDDDGVFVLPARVLAEVEAKRQLLSIHRPYVPEPDQACLGCAGGIMFTSCPVVRLLALPYADHPDYREEWRP